MIDKSASCKTKQENKESCLVEVETKLKKVAKKLTKLEQGSSNKQNNSNNSKNSSINEVKFKPEINNEIEECNKLTKEYNEYCQNFEFKKLDLLGKKEKYNSEVANLNAKKETISEIK